MQVIDAEEYQKIWDKIYSEESFDPSVDSCETWLKPNGLFRTYRLGTMWDEQQEAIINSILCEVVGEEMYALDWHHDCFTFDPNEKIPTGYEYYDSARNVNVFFPTYYPDGDYHFFVSKDWAFGLYGHPWKNEMIVVGEELILAIEKNRMRLGLDEIS